jgi:hypothetical protein
MSAVLFDTHAFVRRMQAAGMPEAQAEAFAGEYTNWLDDRLATKTDLTSLAKTGDLRETELRLEARVESVKADILKWMFGTIGFQTLVLLGAILAIARALH